jgi:hypothetical protein
MANKLPPKLEAVVKAADKLNAAIEALDVPVENFGTKCKPQSDVLSSLALARRNNLTPRKWAEGVVAYNAAPKPPQVDPKSIVETKES